MVDALRVPGHPDWLFTAHFGRYRYSGRYPTYSSCFVSTRVGIQPCFVNTQVGTWVPQPCCFVSTRAGIQPCRFVNNRVLQPCFVNTRVGIWVLKPCCLVTTRIGTRVLKPCRPGHTRVGTPVLVPASASSDTSNAVLPSVATPTGPSTAARSRRYRKRVAWKTAQAREKRMELEAKPPPCRACEVSSPLQRVCVSGNPLQLVCVHGNPLQRVYRATPCSVYT